MLSGLLLAITGLPVYVFATNALNARLAAVKPPECLARFVDYPINGGKDKFVFNRQFWLKDVDFSCVSPWNSAGGRLRAGTAISRRHIVFAKHFPLWKGVRIVFVGEDGGVCPVYIEKCKAIERTDIMIGLLNAELTPNIQPAKILPPDYKDAIGGGSGFPLVTFNQDENAYLTDLLNMPSEGDIWRQITSYRPQVPGRARFRQEIVVGDSGNPAFLLIGKYPILLCCLQGGKCGSGPALHLYRREIQATMDELCPGYKLETFDFRRMGAR